MHSFLSSRVHSSNPIFCQCRCLHVVVHSFVFHSFLLVMVLCCLVSCLADLFSFFHSWNFSFICRHFIHYFIYIFVYSYISLLLHWGSPYVFVLFSKIIVCFFYIIFFICGFIYGFLHLFIYLFFSCLNIRIFFSMKLSYVFIYLLSFST